MDKKRKKQLAYLLAARMSIPFDDFRSIRNVSIANFIATDDTRIRKLLVGIDPVQSGTGDPSPDNVRPISGFTGLTVYKTGENLIVLDSSAGTSSTDNDVEWTKIDGNTIHANGTASDNSACGLGISWTKLFHAKLPPGTYRASCESGVRIRLGLGPDSVNQMNGDGGFTFTLTETNDVYLGLFVVSGTEIDMDIYVMLEVGSTASSYEPYTGTTYPVSWQSEAGTVYCGTLDVLSGLLTVTHANIASYNGESINEPWISSMDVYSSGGTPTTGAQVVYPLATPQTYQLDPVDIQPLLGENNIWADTGDILILDLNY